MDFRGAIRAFEESLEVDPHSAAANFQLAWLYDAKVSNPAAAIYHYEQYLKFDPDAGNAAVVKQRIKACKQKLAEDVLGLPDLPAAQQQIEQLLAQNQQLQTQNRMLEEQNQQLRAGLRRWSVYCASLPASRTNPSPTAAQLAPTVAMARSLAARKDWPASQASRMTIWQKHVVVAGETAVGIARRYGVSLASLLAANPGLEPRRMPVGLILNIPMPLRPSAPPYLEARR